MKIKPVEQGTPEWHAWRDSGVTASEISCIFGSSPFKTHWQLWAEKSGLRQPDDLDGNPYLRRGKRYEHILREKVAASRKMGILPVCVEHDQHALLRASLDGLDKFGRPWEFKIPSERKFEEVRNEREQSLSARTYYLQVQHQTLCTGSSEGYLVFGRIDESNDTPRVADFIVLTIRSDPTVHQEIIRRAAEFHDAVVTGNPPEKDPERDVFSPPTPELAEEWRIHAHKIVPLLQRKAEIEDELSAIKSSLEEHSAPLKDILGENKAGEFAGVRVLRVDRTGSVDWSEYAKSKGDDPKDESVVGKFRKPDTKSYQVKLLTSS